MHGVHTCPLSSLPCKLTEYQSGTQIASQFPTRGPPLCPLLSPLSLLPPCGKGVLKVGGTLFISLKFLKCWCIYYYIQPRCDEVPSVSALVVRCREYTYVHVMARRIGSSVKRSGVKAVVRVYKWLKAGLWMLMKGSVLNAKYSLWCTAVV